MKKYLFLFKGYVTPTPEIGKAWMDWFAAVGDRMVDSGNPISSGFEVTSDAVTAIAQGLDSFTGYCIVNVESEAEALELAQSNPMITSVVLYQLARM